VLLTKLVIHYGPRILFFEPRKQVLHLQGMWHSPTSLSTMIHGHDLYILILQSPFERTPYPPPGIVLYPDLSWQEQRTFLWDVADVRFVLDQHSYYILVRKNIDVNEHDILSNITLTHNQVKEQRFYCCSASEFHSHSMVFNKQHNSYPKMSMKRPLDCISIVQQSIVCICLIYK
jgi:hypothetical protein